MLELDQRRFPEVLQEAGIAGAGGAGFPSYVKWKAFDDMNYLLMNHQESEPNCYSDKWLAHEYPETFGELFESVLEAGLDAIVVGTKMKYRDKWTEPLELATDATIYESKELPLDVASEDGVIFTYAPDVYTYSEEKVLLMITAGEQIGDDLPTEHGWIVHNTETLFNIYQAISKGSPVTTKFVHVDGNTPFHRCLEVPVGTPASTLLKEAGVEDGDLDDTQVLVDGGPGWCYEITLPPDRFGVRKRTNALLVLDSTTAMDHMEEDGQIDVLDVHDWAHGDHEIEPESIDPESVRIPLIANTAYSGFVSPSEPIVKCGDKVSVGDVIAVPREGISNTQHASVKGEVVEITDTQIVIERQ